ncbi:hypothetical protein CANTEDRAFT_118501 [Yamadazyma tenuis ATCC 10573]|uniref:Polynucleotide 5'-hydroxyl-kinase GRC3 n=1 Tax=Candida tenuis (strain ATCC 10573 / BCRC 21748 / CBS 615 / JCM 9827 / NBRC 10315 / NRRL Y-1498 / VKM Y-70) TaxID=590646 RepID=G3AY96_CANTC|nr:uncharacterized protein CANTEDRAFT_118501 [Yamadazyma tenuis ATCC 10573]EGV65796.1 hypothetical protein CANTEDRAFT_118501 [Yamadazyma tenuis ATCC 10573]
MSAYAALREGSIFGEDEEVVIKYDNSSDEEQGIPETILAEVAVPEGGSPSTTFIADEKNLVYSSKHMVVGLKVNESVALSGQFKLVIERGAVLINGIHYYHAPQEFIVIQPNISSLPTISSTQIINSSEVRDLPSDENEHLFCSDYKSVVRLENISTGLENIAKYYQPFKNLFSLPEDKQDLPLQNYTFDILTNNEASIRYDRGLVVEIEGLIDGIEEVSSFITIGNKNSGKSTISKLLLNTLVESSPISILDLDPGQSEYSKPYCLSLTNHFDPIIGFNYHKNENDLHYFYGFTTPQGNPELYLKITKSLIEHYQKNLKPKGHHLIINTPGWVKGYGKELLTEITEWVQPDHLILLSANKLDNEETLSNLVFKNLRIWKGYFVQNRYSAAEVRNFNKLVYFHKTKPLQYNFIDHLLDSSPLKISYQTGEDSSFVGVNVVSILNHDMGLNFDIEDIVLMLDTSIVGLYVIENEYFEAHKQIITYTKNRLPYLSSSKFSDLIEYNTPHVKFMGSGIIHSINVIENFFNLYLSQSEDLETIKKLMLQGYKLLVVKGESDIPKSEILMTELLEEFKRRYKQSFKSKGPLPTFPYVSYNNKINGVWKIRRNIMRRGQH